MEPRSSVGIWYHFGHLLQKGIRSFGTLYVRVDRMEHPFRVVLEYPGMQIVVMQARRQERFMALHRPIKLMAKQ